MKTCCAALSSLILSLRKAATKKLNIKRPVDQDWLGRCRLLISFAKLQENSFAKNGLNFGKKCAFLSNELILQYFTPTVFTDLKN
jgi:hypothetical protein